MVSWTSFAIVKACSSIRLLSASISRSTYILEPKSLVFMEPTRSTPRVSNAACSMDLTVYSSHALTTNLSMESLNTSRAAFTMNIQMTKLANGSMTGTPILAPRIPIKAPTEDSASLR